MKNDEVYTKTKTIIQYLAEMIADKELDTLFVDASISFYYIERIELISSIWNELLSLYHDEFNASLQRVLPDDFIEECSSHFKNLLLFLKGEYNFKSSEQFMIVKQLEKCVRSVKLFIIHYRTAERLIEIEDEYSKEENGFKQVAKKDDSKFDVALSFAGEQRDYVRKVAENLDRLGIRVFYDEFYGSKMWGKNLMEFLHYVYESDCEFCVIFVSKEYQSKFYPTQEKRSAISDKAKVMKDRILQVKFDEVDLPGLPTATHYLKSSDYEPSELASIIKERIGPKSVKVQRNVQLLQNCTIILKEMNMLDEIPDFESSIELLRNGSKLESLMILERGINSVMRSAVFMTSNIFVEESPISLRSVIRFFPEIALNFEVFRDICSWCRHLVDVEEISFYIILAHHLVEFLSVILQSDITTCP